MNYIEALQALICGKKVREKVTYMASHLYWAPGVTIG